MVDFLIGLNDNRRDEKNIDKHFIKTLLIGVLSVKAIKANEDFDDGYVSFIKGALELFLSTTSIVKKKNSSLHRFVQLPYQQ